jgi:WD40 repeat protein
VKYDAFISYSHATDNRLAPAVQSALHWFAKPWYRLRMLHVFRDQTSLAMTPELWGAIAAALSESRYFLLCASPESAQSAWVQKEVEWWLTNRDSKTLFILLTDGEVVWNPEAGDFDWNATSALPVALRGAFPSEPLYVDLRFARGADELSLRNSQFRDAILDIAAPLHGRSKDELGGADVREHRRTLRTAWAAATALAVLFVAAAIAAWIATIQRDLSRSRELAALARNQITIDPEVSLELAADAMEIRSTVEARQMLRTALLESHLRRAIGGHSGEITGLDVSSTGDRAVSIGLDGSMLVWSPTDGRVLHTLEGYRGAVSADGTRAATSVKDHRLAVWDLETGKPLAVIGGASESVTAVGLSPDGHIAVSGHRDGAVRMHDADDGRQIASFNMNGIVTDLLFSPDGRKLAIGAIYNRIAVWDLDANRVMFETLGISAAISPDGRLLVTGGADDSGVRLIDMNDGEQLALVGARQGSMGQVRFGPDGELLAAASSDGRARVWRRDGSQVAVLSGHETWVEDVAFSPDGNFIVTGSRDQTARVWSVASGREIATLRGHQAAVTVVRVSPDGSRIFTGAKDGAIRIWDAGMAHPRRFLRGPVGAVQQLAFSADGRYVLAAQDTGETQIWDSRADRQIAIRGSVFALGRAAIATAAEEGDDYVLRLWSFDGAMEAELGHQGDTVSSLTFSPDERFLVSTSEDGSALVIELGSHETRTIEHDDGLSDAAFNSEGTQLATSDDKGTTKLWRFPSLEPIAAFEASDAILSTVAFTVAGDRVITGSWDGTIGVWDARNGSKLRSIETGLERVDTFELVKGEDRVIAGGSNGLIEVWDLDTGKRLRQNRGHSDGIYQIALSPALPLFASASNDGSARLWDLETGEQIAAFAAHSSEVWSVAFSPDGRTIVTGSEDRDAHIYECSVCTDDVELMRMARDRLQAVKR